MKMAKYIRQIRKLAHPKILLTKSSFLLKLLGLFLELRKTRKNSSSWQPSYFRMEKMFMLQIHTLHSVLNSLEFKGRIRIPSTIFTALFSVFELTSLHLNAPEGLCKE